MPAVVLDASWVAAFAFEDEASSAADALYAVVLRDGIIVPAIWPLEVANMLRQGERRGRIAPINMAATMDRLRAIPCEIEATALNDAFGPILDLARKHALTGYDASYLELACRLRLPLATRDTELIVAAKAEAVPLL